MKKTSNIMLAISCLMIILYTIAAFGLQYATSIEVSSTLTTAWFGFWGAEIISLAAIKTSKVKHKYEEWKHLQDSVEEEEYIEEEEDYTLGE